MKEYIKYLEKTSGPDPWKQDLIKDYFQKLFSFACLLPYVNYSKKRKERKEKRESEKEKHKPLRTYRIPPLPEPIFKWLS